MNPSWCPRPVWTLNTRNLTKIRRLNHVQVMYFLDCIILDVVGQLDLKEKCDCSRCRRIIVLRVRDHCTRNSAGFGFELSFDTSNSIEHSCVLYKTSQQYRNSETPPQCCCYHGTSPPYLELAGFISVRPPLQSSLLSSPDDIVPELSWTSIKCT